MLLQMLFRMLRLDEDVWVPFGTGHRNFLVENSKQPMITRRAAQNKERADFSQAAHLNCVLNTLNRLLKSGEGPVRVQRHRVHRKGQELRKQESNIESRLPRVFYYGKSPTTESPLPPGLLLLASISPSRVHCSTLCQGKALSGLKGSNPIKFTENKPRHH